MNQKAAIFDVDGTLVRSDIVDYYLFLIKRAGSRWARTWRLAKVVLSVPYWLLLDRRDRSIFNDRFYRSYRGLSAKEMKALASLCFEEVLKRKLINGTVERLRRHREQGDRILLVSGSLDFILEPLARHVGADSVLCARLEEEEESFSGRLSTKPVIGEEKARLVCEFARRESLDLSESFAYADSESDMPLLSLVGHPVAVRPAKRLRLIAQKNGWDVLEN